MSRGRRECQGVSEGGDRSARVVTGRQGIGEGMARDGHHEGMGVTSRAWSRGRGHGGMRVKGYLYAKTTYGALVWWECET